MIARRQMVTATNTLNVTVSRSPWPVISGRPSNAPRPTPKVFAHGIDSGVTCTESLARSVRWGDLAAEQITPKFPWWRLEGLIPCPWHPLKIPCGFCSCCPGSELRDDGPAPVWNTVGLRIERTEETSQTPALASESSGKDGSIISSRVD